MKYKIIVLMLSLLALMSNMAFAESINVTFTDPERNAFVNKTISLEIDKYNRIVLPKTFAETVNVNIPSSQKVDDETYYFDSDWETNESSYPYSFTGWQILGTATRIPSVTTYHAGDYIDFEFLAEDPNTESINKNSLIMTACWGKTVFVRNKYNTMKYNKYGIFEDEISSQSGATGADDANSGRKVTEPKASMPEAYRLFDTDNTDYDAYKNVVMLVGNLDYIKPNSTSSNQPGYSTVYAHAYWGYLTNMGSVANNVRNATMKSLLTLSTVPNLKMKAFNWTTTFNGSIIFDNVDMSVAKEADFIDFNKSLLYLSHGMQINNHKMYIALSNRAKNTQRSGFTFYASANYNIVNGGYISSYIYSSGGGWNAKPTYLVGINGEVGTMYLGTTNGNFAQDHASEIHYYGNGGMVGNLFGSSEASNHITKKDRYITSKTQTITNLYGGGAAAPLYGSTNLDIKGCNITSLYGGGRDFTANIYGDIHINVEDSTINSIFCGGKNGNVMKVPEDAPYGVVGTGGHIYFDLKNSTIANDIFGSGSGGSQTISVSNYKAYPVNSDYWESDEWAKPFSDYPKYDPETQMVATYRYKSTSAGYRTSSVGAYRYKYFSYLSLATIESIEMNIDSSTVNGNIYGGGSIAVVNGNTKINLTNGTTIKGSVYGGGDGVTKPGTVTVYKPLSGEGYTPPNITNVVDEGGGLYSFSGASESSKTSNSKYGNFTWSNDESLLATDGIDIARKLIYSPNTEGLGAVKGNTEVIINGSEVVGNVFAGGNAGMIGGNTTLTLNNHATVGGTIYAGGNNGDVQGSTTTNIDASTLNTIYGGGNNGRVLQNSNVTISSGTIDTAFGGGNLGTVEGNTNVIVGNSSNPYVTISSLLYGGGRGSNASFETVKGNSTVLIEGLNTSVENYGSSKLGKVVGEVNVTFKDYWTGNSTNKYKTMNGIDRATNVIFDNSYVLLANKSETGALEGIKDITNLYVEEGSGLKVSAPGNLLGDFHGGGDLFLDSEVCLTINGDIYGETMLVLNPLIYTDLNMIKGTKNNPYMDIKGTDYSSNNNALYSSDGRYSILKTDETGSILYYIEKDVIIRDKIENVVSNAKGAVYTTDASTWATDDVYVRDSGIVTANVDVTLNFEKNNNQTLYSQVTRKISMVSRDVKQNWPTGTVITIFDKTGGALYTYTVNSAIQEIPVNLFKNKQNGNNFTELTNVANDNNLISDNEITKIKVYEYSENYRIIMDFSGVNPNELLPKGPYNFMMNFYDNNQPIELMMSKANNIIRIEEDRQYNNLVTFDKEYYEGDSIINITSKLSGAEDVINEEIYNKPFYLVLSIVDEFGEYVLLDNGMTIKINGEEKVLSGTNTLVKLMDTLPKNAFDITNTVQINMQNIQEALRLKSGTYKLVFDYYSGTNDMTLQKKVFTYEAPFRIERYTHYSLLAEMKASNATGTNIINVRPNTTRTIKIDYVGELIVPYLDIEVRKAAGNNSYIATTNTFLTNKINPLLATQEISFNIPSGTASGVYKIEFILKDKVGTEKAREALLFKVN